MFSTERVTEPEARHFLGDSVSGGGRPFGHSLVSKNMGKLIKDAL